MKLVYFCNYVGCGSDFLPFSATVAQALSFRAGRVNDTGNIHCLVVFPGHHRHVLLVHYHCYSVVPRFTFIFLENFFSQLVHDLACYAEQFQLPPSQCYLYESSNKIQVTCNCHQPQNDVWSVSPGPEFYEAWLRKVSSWYTAINI